MVSQEKYPVVQSNFLVEAQYKLDTVEQKVLRYLISMITPRDDTLEKKFYRVRIEELQEYLGWNPKSGELFQYIRKVADKLKATTIKIIKPNTTIVTSWIASYEYPKNLGWIEFEFSSKLETELLQLKEQFTQYYLKNVAKLRSQYSIRLYELLKQYVSFGERKESIANLRAMLGIEKHEYKQYEHLKSRILNPSHREINQKTDIEFDWEPIKEARKVVGILFFDIKQKTLIPGRILTMIPKKYRNSKQVLNTIRKYMELYNEDYVIEKISYTNAQNPKKWVNYFKLVMEKNFGEGYTDQNNSTYVEDPQARAVAQRKKEEEEKEKKIKEEYHKYQSKTVSDYLATLPASKIEEIEKSFEKNLSNNFLRSMFKTDGFDSLAIQVEYTQYVYMHHIPPQLRLNFLDFSRNLLEEDGKLTPLPPEGDGSFSLENV